MGLIERVSLSTKNSYGFPMKTILKKSYHMRSKFKYWPLALAISSYAQFSNADFEIEYVNDATGVIYHSQDQNWTGDWVYLCVAEECYTAELEDEKYKAVVGGLSAGNQYVVEFKIEDLASPTGQFIANGELLFENPDPLDTTSEPSTQAIKLGLDFLNESEGEIFRVDENFTGEFVYLCVDEDCRSGTLIDGRWVRNVSNLIEGQTYTIGSKIDHTPLIVEEVEWVFQPKTITDTSTDSTTGTDIDSATDTSSETDTDSLTYTGTDTDSFTDTGSETETDTDSSTDTSSGTDTDSLTDDISTETDTDSLADTSTETDTDSLTDTGSETDTDSLTDTSSETDTDSLTDTGSETDTDSLTDTGSETDTDSLTDTSSETDTDSLTDTSSATDTDSLTDTDTEMDTDSLTDTSSETDTDSLTDTSSATDTDSLTDTSSETDTDSLTDTSSETDTDSLNDISTETDTDSLTDAGSATDTDSLTDTSSETDTDSLTDTSSETDTDSVTDTDTATDTETQTDSGSDTTTDTSTDSSSATDTDSETDSDTDTSSDLHYSQVLFPEDSNEYDVFFDDGSKIVTQFAGRGHRRHEPSGIDGMDPNGNPSNPNHYNYHFEYWQDRIYTIKIEDFVAHGDSRLVITLDTIGAHANNSANPGSNVPYVKCGKDFGNETNYFHSPAPVYVGPNKTEYVFTRYMQDLDLTTGYNYESVADINREFQVGDILECEVTIRWQSIVDAGETDEANYYGQIMRYRVGVGGLVGYNRDPNVGVYVNDESSLIGGYTTYQPLGYNERPRSYMQMTPNMQLENIEDFLNGRRLFRTSVFDGSHWDASNSSNGQNPGVPEMALGLYNFDDRCSDCHLDDGNGTHTVTAADMQTPRIVGMGLLEAIPESVIASWADPEDENGDGISGELSIVNGGYIGRFGYSASMHSVEAQVAAAFYGEMNFSPEALAHLPEDSEFNYQNVIQKVTRYMQLLAVPAARTPNLKEHQGWDEFNEFGCADCHKTDVVTGNHPLTELRNQTFHPFTDLLLHDLGQDDVDEIRTTPLMGIGLSGAVRSVAKDHEFIRASTGVNMANNTAMADLLTNRDDNDYMIWHDGSCTGPDAFDCAIRKHGGEAAQVRSRYENADVERQQQLIQFLKDI